MILINFKVYRQSFGKGAMDLARICKKVAEESGIKIIPVVSPFDVYRIKSELGMEVMVQHVDGLVEGAKSGAITIEQAKITGAIGSLLNHSEKRLKPGQIKSILGGFPDDFKSVVCVQTLGQTLRWAGKISPTMIAYEPKELIGNKEKSVATEKPEVIWKMVDLYGKIPVLVGAGIHSTEDVKIALSLGAKGILVASDVVTAKDPEKELTKLTEGFGVH